MRIKQEVACLQQQQQQHKNRKREARKLKELILLIS
jgi:hypothetical protein